MLYALSLIVSVLAQNRFRMSEMKESISLSSIGNTGEQSIEETNSFYALTLPIGTPTQIISMRLCMSECKVIMIPTANDVVTQTTTFYNETASSTYKAISKGEKYYSLNGTMSTDTIKFGKIEITDQSFFLTKISSVDSFDRGILALSLSKESNNSFLNRIKSGNLAKYNTFAFDLVEKEMIIGEKEFRDYKSHTTVNFTLNMEKFTGTFTSFAVGNKSISLSQEAQFFIQKDIIKGPTAEIDKLRDLITSGKNCTDYVCNCNILLDGYQPISFTVGGATFQIQPKNFIKFKDNKCTLKIETSSQRFWTIGQPVFAEYFALFDLDNSTLSLIHYYNKSGDVDIVDEIKDQTEDFFDRIWSSWTLTIAASVAALFLICVLYCCCCRKSDNDYDRY
ncbi:hypothetical protein SteCoe_37968 [Stentor coeruleus]|uniref:Peptidase A1 domain-containing protein n=1 Tax=Stentor coeruleus TaxID=5963 RepID=A0A1R2AM17_9CILI|nr:hypothetical protein SteCoe_37968 [Stentor coeruleus]